MLRLKREMLEKALEAAAPDTRELIERHASCQRRELEHSRPKSIHSKMSFCQVYRLLISSEHLLRLGPNPCCTRWRISTELEYKRTK